MGLCMVMRNDGEGGDVYLATFVYDDKSDSMAWVTEFDDTVLNEVTHFCIPEPVEIEA